MGVAEGDSPLRTPESWHDLRMASVLRRVVAFAPLLSLAVVTAAAGTVGYREGQHRGPSATPGRATPLAAPTESPSATPFIKDKPSRVPPVPTFAPVALSEAKDAWDHGLDKLIAAGSGKYSWAVYVGSSSDPLQSENGAFDLDPLRSRFDRTIADPSGDAITVHVRRLGTTTFMRFDDWGRWEGCWLSVTNQDVERATGVETGHALPLPASVLAIGDAAPSMTRGFWFGAPYREYTAELSAAEALQFLGISPKVYLKQLDRLRNVKVPITVSLDAQGRMHGGGARGNEVAKAIKEARIKLSSSLLAGLPSLRASLEFRDPGSPVTVDTPPPSSMLPQRPTRRDTCEHGGPHA